MAKHFWKFYFKSTSFYMNNPVLIIIWFQWVMQKSLLRQEDKKKRTLKLKKMNTSHSIERKTAMYKKWVYKQISTLNSPNVEISNGRKR